MKKIYIRDRKVGEIFLLENEKGELIEVDSKFVFDSKRDGDILFKKGEKYYFDQAETKLRKNNVDSLMEGMWVGE